jgi:hypothetical protein
MERHLFLKRALVATYAVFASASCSELAEIALLCILGLIASVLVMMPGDQTLGGLIALCQMLSQCG